MVVLKAATVDLSPAMKPAGLASGREYFILIDSRRLERECFLRSIEHLRPEISMAGYSSAEEFLNLGEARPRTGSVLFNMGSRQISDPEVVAELKALAGLGKTHPVIVLGRSDDVADMIAAFGAGATGYIPGNIGIEAIVEAAVLAASGGVFLRFESLLKLRPSPVDPRQQPAECQLLTGRQAAVADALRRGKANKTIAYDLNMCESTVKVHIRTIMRKLNARNRTEAAFKLNALLPSQSVHA